jgi:hypothetical protein
MADTDTPVLRACLVDGCTRRFALAAWMDGRLTTPQHLSGAGWVRLSGTRYLCPDHADQTGDQQ